MAINKYRLTLSRIIKFLQYDIWRIPVSNISGTRHFLINQIRILIIAVRGYEEDKLQLRAASLTFYTLLSVVPIAAMIFGIAKGFGFDKVLENEIRNNLTGQEDVVEKVITFSNTLLESTKGELMAGIGITMLLWTVISIFSSIEESFNAIFDVKKGRTYLRKFSDYFSLMLIAPIFLVLASSVSVYVATVLTSVQAQYVALGTLAPLFNFIINLLPFVLIWSLFTLIYLIMPNTRVQFRSALIAGVIAGTVFTGIQWGYIYFQVGVSKYNAIYGSFAALPLFMIWLQLSWLVVLIGAEMAYANQNVGNFEYEKDISNISHEHKRFLSLLVMHVLVKKFEIKHNLQKYKKGNIGVVVPPTTKMVATNIGIPFRLARQILGDLINCGLVVEVNVEGQQERSYQPAIDINKLTVLFVLNRLDKIGSNHIKPKDTVVVEQLNMTLLGFNSLMEATDGNFLLKDLVDGPPVPEEIEEEEELAPTEAFEEN